MWLSSDVGMIVKMRWMFMNGTTKLFMLRSCQLRYHGEASCYLSELCLYKLWVYLMNTSFKAFQENWGARIMWWTSHPFPNYLKKLRKIHKLHKLQTYCESTDFIVLVLIRLLCLSEKKDTKITLKCLLNSNQYHLNLNTSQNNSQTFSYISQLPYISLLVIFCIIV